VGQTVTFDFGSLRGSFNAYHSSLVPIRAIRGPVMAVGRNHEPPEV
jgi:hypothetical protein